MKERINGSHEGGADKNERNHQNTHINSPILGRPTHFHEFLITVYKVLFHAILNHKDTVKNPPTNGTVPYDYRFEQDDFLWYNNKIYFGDIMPLLKQILREGVITLTLMTIGLVTTVAIPTAAASAIKTPDQLCQLGGFACPEGEDGIQKTKNLVGKLAYNLRLVIGAVAVLVIVISGIKLITAAGNEEVFRKESTAIIFGVIGLATITLAGEVSEILSVEGGGFFASNNQAVAKSRLFHRATEIIITFLKYIIGSVAVIFIVRNGMRLVLLGGNEEEVTKDKKNIFYGMFGLVLILIANPIVNQVFFKIDMSKYPGTEAVAPGIDMKRLLLEIAGMTNLVAALAGPLALLSLVAGGLMYVVAAGDDEKIGKAKKIITWSLIGLVVMYSAFALVSLFVAREFNGI